MFQGFGLRVQGKPNIGPDVFRVSVQDDLFQAEGASDFCMEFGVCAWFRLWHVQQTVAICSDNPKPYVNPEPLTLNPKPTSDG